MKDEVGIGFIGTGFARRVQMPAFAVCEGARLVSVSSGSLENAKAAAEEFGIEHFSDDWCKTVSHPEVDLVCITTPPIMHRDMVLFAIENGKHLLAEKPMAMSVAEAEEMTEAANSAGVLALIDHELRYLPGRIKAKVMLHEGAIGKVVHAKYNFRAPHRGDPTAEWDWWSDCAAGGGALGAINSHVIDSFNWFLETDINSVFCQLQTHIKQRPFKGEMCEVTTDDEANMLLRFSDSTITTDATGIVSVSMIEGPEYLNQIEFVGTEGWLRVGHRGDVHIAKRGQTEMTAIDVDYPPSIDGVFESGFPSGFMAIAPKIVEGILSGSPKINNAATFQDGVKVQKVLDAARESNANGNSVSI